MHDKIPGPPDTYDYPEVGVGGPAHGAVFPPGDLSDDEAEFRTLAPDWVRAVFTDQADPEEPVYATYKYRREVFEILGERITFWILEDLWKDRRRFVRNLVLSCLFRSPHPLAEKPDSHNMKNDD